MTSSPGLGPILIMRTPAPKFSPAEQTPDFDLRHPRCGHNMYMDQPAPVAEAITRFIECGYELGIIT